MKLFGLLVVASLVPLASGFRLAPTPASARSRPWSRGALVRAAQPDPALEGEGAGFLEAPLARPTRAPLLLGFWAVFSVYAFILSPGGDAAAQAADTELLKTMASNPFDGAVNPVFAGLFNALGLLPIINMSILLPGGKDQKPLPALPFVVGSFALGFFALGPYLGLREYRPQVAKDDVTGVSKFLETKANGAFVTASAVGLIAYVATHFGDNTVADFLQLFGSSRFAHISSLDFTVLSLCNYATISEDMRRRDWFSPGKAMAFTAVPLLGPAAYLLLRPSLPEA